MSKTELEPSVITLKLKHACAGCLRGKKKKPCMQAQTDVRVTVEVDGGAGWTAGEVSEDE